MARYSIGVLCLPGNPHTACFDDFADAMGDALRALGREVVEPGDKSARMIFFGGANKLPEGALPPDAIIYNAEQVAARDGAFLARNYDQHKERVIWDYSKVNVEALRARGLRAVHCPVGYAPSMTKRVLVGDAHVQPAKKDVDVLFYGSVNPRRQVILGAIQRAGLRVEALFNMYGPERDWWIARAKIVLNLHYYERPIFEIFRVSHLLANKACVVSEDGGVDPELEAFADRATRLVSYDRIVETCQELIADEDARRAQAERGFEEFKKISLVENVRKAIEESSDG